MRLRAAFQGARGSSRTERPLGAIDSQHHFARGAYIQRLRATSLSLTLDRSKFGAGILAHQYAPRSTCEPDRRKTKIEGARIVTLGVLISHYE